MKISEKGRIYKHLKHEKKMETHVSKRNINKDVFNEFKALAVKKRMKLGQALTMAMSEWLDEELEIPKKSLLELKPFSWGKNTNITSKEIDEIVYGA